MTGQWIILTDLTLNSEPKEPKEQPFPAHQASKFQRACTVVRKIVKNYKRIAPHPLRRIILYHFNAQLLFYY